jgi:hypothetical protein
MTGSHNFFAYTIADFISEFLILYCSIDALFIDFSQNIRSRELESQKLFALSEAICASSKLSLNNVSILVFSINGFFIYEFGLYFLSILKLSSNKLNFSSAFFVDKSEKFHLSKNRIISLSSGILADNCFNKLFLIFNGLHHKFTNQALSIKSRILLIEAGLEFFKISSTCDTTRLLSKSLFLNFSIGTFFASFISHISDSIGLIPFPTLIDLS